MGGSPYDLRHGPVPERPSTVVADAVRRRGQVLYMEEILHQEMCMTLWWQWEATIGGPLHFKPNFSATGVCFPVPRPYGVNLGCLSLQLELYAFLPNVVFPPSSTPSGGYVQSSTFDGHILAQSGVVSRPPAVVNRRVLVASTTPGPSKPATLTPRPPRSPVA